MNNTIVFLGDSLTEYGNWRELFPGLDIHNRGISGDTADGVLGRLDGVIALQPGKVFLMVGINDLFMGRTVGRVLDDYRKILERFKEELPQSEVFVQSVLPVESSDGLDEEIREMNEGLKELAAEYGCPYIDLYTPFSDTAAGINPDYTYDGVHLTKEGYAAWKREITDFLS